VENLEIINFDIEIARSICETKNSWKKSVPKLTSFSTLDKESKDSKE
jgi:hypothetical protein